MRIKSRTYFVFATILAFAALVVPVNGQSISQTQNKADQKLRSDTRINPFTLGMELQIPLAYLPGRAGNSKPIVLQYSSKVWGTWPPDVWETGIGTPVTDLRPKFAEGSVRGWTSSLSAPYIQFSEDLYYHPQEGYEGQLWTGEQYVNVYYINRVKVSMPDGSVYDLRKDDALHLYQWSQIDRSGTYLAVDGSATRLEYDTGQSTFYFGDGARIVWEASGTIVHIDRNGNRMSYESTTHEWTDTMGRVLTNPFFSGPTEMQTFQPTVGVQQYAFPGFDGQDQEVEFVWAQLSSQQPTPGYVSGRYCHSFMDKSLPSGSTILFPIAGVPTNVCDWGTSPFNPIVLNEIRLADGSSYKFHYNLYAEIDKIEYPTGGYERFEYSQITPIQSANDSGYDQLNRGVAKRWISVDGTAPSEILWQYGVTRVNQELPTDYYRVRTTGPDGSYTDRYLFDQDSDLQSPYGFGNIGLGRPYDERTYSASGQLLARSLTSYAKTGMLAGGYSGATRDLRPEKQISIIFEPGNGSALATMSETVYDTTGNSDPAYFSLLNPKQLKKYNYIVVGGSTATSANVATATTWFSSGDLVSITENDYLYDADYKARNISGLVTETRVKDTAGNVKARTQITYDEAAFELASTGSLPTAAAGSWIDPDTELGTSIGPKRGFATTIKEYKDISAGQYITTNTFHDQYGNVRKIRDGRGNETETIYDNSYAFGYLTSVISAVPDDSGTKGSDTAHVNSFTYDINTGLMLTSTDPNLQVTTFQYEDPLLRRTKVISPNGHETITEYGSGITPSDQWTKVTSQTTATESKAGITYFDGMGRIVRTRSVREGAADILSDTTYDNLGRVKYVSNPYFEGDVAQSSEVFYDSLGRMIKTVYPDESETLTDYGLATAGSAIGFTVTSTDQSGKKRRAILDARSLILRVDEADANGSLGPVDQPYQPSDYSYDILTNLTQVVQAGNSNAQCSGASTCSQTRSFSYDALSRLVSASHPEDGTTTFTYDGNGNVLTRVDARGVTTSSEYDRLNRLLTKSFTGESAFITPTVSHYYDNVTNAKGKLVRVASSVADTRYTEFDSMGMAETSEQRVTPDQLSGSVSPYSFEYSYDLAGNIDEVTYPSSRRVKYDRDVNGYLAEVQSMKNPTAESRVYASNFSYNAAGKYTGVRLGNGLWEKRVYNDRLQLAHVSLGTAPSSSNRLKIENGYGVWNGTNVEADKNNGGIARQTITVPGRGSTSGFTAVQTYEYDSQNRLLDAVETISGQTWRQRFKYDRYGNRTFDESVTTTLPKQCLDGSQPVVCQETRERLNPSVSVANNRLTADQDSDTSEEYQHDANGNVTKDVANGSFSFDADNRQVEFRNPSNQIVAKYRYDGYGNRISKEYPATGEITYFVYDAFGNLAAEYSTSTPVNHTHFSTVDALDSPRIVTDQFGRVASRDDFHPFGESVSVSRPSELGYGAAPLRKKFAQYERETESTLDFAQARYYSPEGGRFRSVDPVLIASADKPQSWNRYVYALNNPTSYSDGKGRWPTEIHDQILSNAFPGLTHWEVRAMQLGSFYVDAPGTIFEKNAPQHAMRNPQHTEGQAEAAMNEFIAEATKEARATQGSGPVPTDTSRYAFGQAMHPVMDNTSPAHRPFQVFKNPSTASWIINPGGKAARYIMEMRDHKKREATISPAQMNSTVAQIQSRYLDTYGEGPYIRAVYGDAVYNQWSAQRRQQQPKQPKKCKEGKGQCTEVIVTVGAEEEVRRSKAGY